LNTFCRVEDAYLFFSLADVIGLADFFDYVVLVYREGARNLNNYTVFKALENQRFSASQISYLH